MAKAMTDGERSLQLRLGPSPAKEHRKAMFQRLGCHACHATHWFKVELCTRLSQSRILVGWPARSAGQKVVRVLIPCRSLLGWLDDD